MNLLLYQATSLTCRNHGHRPGLTHLARFPKIIRYRTCTRQGAVQPPLRALEKHWLLPNLASWNQDIDRARRSHTRPQDIPPPAKSPIHFSQIAELHRISDVLFVCRSIQRLLYPSQPLIRPVSESPAGATQSLTSLTSTSERTGRLHSYL